MDKPLNSQKPEPRVVDYDTLRKNTPFTWSVGSTVMSLIKLAGLTYRNYFLDFDENVRMYKEGEEKLAKLFDGFPMPNMITPSISYGHVNCLGAELIFPENGEVGIKHLCSTVKEGIELLKSKRGVDFSKEGMFPFYAEFSEKLKAAFPGRSVWFGFGVEGPLTTSYELLGDRIFTEIYDEPELCAEFLDLLTDSINDYSAALRRLDGDKPFPDDTAYLADDIASMIPDSLWPEFVLPFWEKYYRFRTSGKRNIHIEGLLPNQLKFLEEARIERYDPSISTMLTPAIIEKTCKVPFMWRIGSFHFPQMSKKDTADFVYLAAADGANNVHTYIADDTLDPETVEKITIFRDTAQKVQKLLSGGMPRTELRKFTGYSDSAEYWDNWRGYKGKPQFKKG
ncbi:MAG TPA: uroporphyrinogen decarboxylase family protein [Oscillospiraceae bacterium]|nr:uroporphyrinogen decarboxylase family protein [Oscillospiraceae bacterium]HPS35398.1 uroporphyrinogen decarboxylase family protein [Oscillospiraceae bacterium]